MIYCVIPQALADDLYEKLTDYYRDDPGVEVIVDRRKSERRERGSHRRRQARDPRPPPPAPGHVPAPRARLSRPERVVVHVDGGARGNPGPAGVGVVVTDEHGTELDRANDYIGVATNNDGRVPGAAAGARARARARAHARSRSSTTPSSSRARSPASTGSRRTICGPCTPRRWPRCASSTAGRSGRCRASRTSTPTTS